MPHILILLDPKCADLEDTVRKELSARYGDEFGIIDPNEVITGDPGDVAPLVVCWSWVNFSKRLNKAETHVAITRRLVPGDSKEAVFVFASIRHDKTIVFVILPDGGGIMQWVEKPLDTFPLPKENTLRMVFNTIEANDKERFS